jgi:hypothetical protein
MTSQVYIQMIQWLQIRSFFFTESYVEILSSYGLGHVLIMHVRRLINFKIFDINIMIANKLSKQWTVGQNPCFNTYKQFRCYMESQYVYYR